MTNEERKRPQRRPSWFATLFVAGLLVAVGFAVGLLAGTAYEEPELVAEHLAGRTALVALGESPEGAAQPPTDDVAAAPPREAPAVEPLPTPLGAGGLDQPREHKPAAPAKPQALDARPAPAQGGAFAIQVGAFGTESTAQQLASELGKRGFPSYVAEDGTGARFKVRVGPIASRSEAERVSGRLKAEHRLPTWIMAGKS